MHPLTKPRPKPYVWASWLPKLMAGESSCVWSVWFRAHHFAARPADDGDFDLEAWRLDHTGLLRKAAAQYKEEGYTVFVEDQNQFVLKGKHGSLAGKPDIAAVRGGEGLILDGKTGQPRASDRLQVMLYMWALPLAVPAFKEVRFSGRVQYRARYTLITPDEVNAEFRSRVGELMRQVCGPTPPHKAPAFRECRHCPLAPEDCGDRVTTEAVYAGVTEEF